MMETRSSLIAMAMATLALVALAAARMIGASPMAVPLLAAVLAVTLERLSAWITRAENSRTALAGLAFLNGVLGVAGAVTTLVAPALAGAAYEPESDWLRNLDLTPPAIRSLRVALASGYFALALIIAGIGFFIAAYLLFRRGAGRQRHAH